MSPGPEIGKVSNRANYWQFHFGGEGGFKLGELLAVSFWGGRGVSNWVKYWQFHFGEGGGGVHMQVDW